MQRTTVSSSNISSIGYNVEYQILEVEFLNGSVYQYFNISQSLYQGLMNAVSHGTYLDRYIKKGRFKYKRIAQVYFNANYTLYIEFLKDTDSKK